MTTQPKGFTVIEVLVSSLVLGVIMSIIIAFLVNANRATYRAQLESNLNSQAQSALSRFSRDLLGASGVATNSTSQKLILELPCYDATGDINEATKDQVIYELNSEGKLLYTRGALVGQVILDHATDDTPVFRYFNFNLVEGAPQDASMVRVTLHTIENLTPKAVNCRQTQDFRMRNAL